MDTTSHFFIAQSLIELVFVTMILSAQSAPYIPKDNYLIACGSSIGSLTDSDGRQWTGDAAPKSTYLDGNTQSVAASTTQQNPNIPGTVPFLNGRIFKNPASYSFPVTPGRHWLRLYFYPFAYDTYDMNNAIITVKLDSYILMRNLSIVQETTALNFDYIQKEYSINVTSSSCVISFIPAGNSTSTFAMVNGIELVSMPEDLFVDSILDVDASQSIAFGINSIALETMYRINVGGQAVTAAGDELSRMWMTDIGYITTAGTGVSESTDHSISFGDLDNYTAPQTVYQTARTMTNFDLVNLNYNLTWHFQVDPAFTYYIRLHFCELDYPLINQRVFDIYINTQLAYQLFDVVAKAGGQYIATVQDFAIAIPADLAWNASSIVVALHPTNASQSFKFNSILNGLEVFKMNDSQGNLQGPPPPLVTVPGNISPQPSNHSSKTKSILGGLVGAAAFLLLLVGAGLFCRRSRSNKLKSQSGAWHPLPLHAGSSHSTMTKASNATSKSGVRSLASSASSDICRHFSFAEILDMTNHFDEACVLGVGGFGKVYEGLFDDGTKVAVKRGIAGSDQGLAEFQTEVELLSKLRHRHLVSLLGFCEEHGEMILVYDYMANGPLRGHLYGTNLPPLSWKQRLDICIGAARGLHYLHTGAAQGIIHRDVKTTNILLDENFVAKVSDFGLSKTGPTLDQTHVSTAVKGSFGYLDPEYFRRQQLTDKSDVYSFGVVLMEVLCARPALDPALPREEVNLAEWAMKWQRKGELEHIIDPHIAGQISTVSLRSFGQTAAKCLSERGTDRPTMGKVLWELEYVLNDSVVRKEIDDSNPRILDMPLNLPKFSDSEDSSRAMSGIQEDNYSTSRTSKTLNEDSDDASRSAVFSQLVSPQGR